MILRMHQLALMALLLGLPALAQQSQTDEDPSAIGSQATAVEPLSLPPMNPDYIDSFVNGPSAEACRDQINPYVRQAAIAHSHVPSDEAREVLQRCHLSESYFSDAVELAELEANALRRQTQTAALAAVSTRLTSTRGEISQHQSSMARLQNDFESFDIGIDSLNALQRIPQFCDQGQCYKIWSAFECQFSNADRGPRDQIGITVTNSGGDQVADPNDGSHYVRFIDHLDNGFVDVQILRILMGDHEISVARTRDGGIVQAQIDGGFSSDQPFTASFQVIQQRRFSYFEDHRQTSMRVGPLSLNCSRSRPFFALTGLAGRFGEWGADRRIRVINRRNDVFPRLP